MTIDLYIFDADNTLRRTRITGQPCPRNPDEWELLPNVRRVLSTIPWSPDGPFLGIASNQDQVAYGYLSASVAGRLLSDMVKDAVGAIELSPFIQFCPHALDVACDCRKPAPGMLLAAMRHFRMSPMNTLFVGDAPTDREAAQRAGVKFELACRFFGRPP